MATKTKKGKGSASKQKVSNVSKDMSIEELKVSFFWTFITPEGQIP